MTSNTTTDITTSNNLDQKLHHAAATFLKSCGYNFKPYNYTNKVCISINYQADKGIQAILTYNNKRIVGTYSQTVTGALGQHLEILREIAIERSNH